MKKCTTPIMVFDNVLNWAFAVSFTFFPRRFEALVTELRLPLVVWVGMGLIFFVLAGWQVWLFVRSWRAGKGVTGGISRREFSFLWWLDVSSILGLGAVLLLPGLFQILGAAYWWLVAAELYMMVLWVVYGVRK